MIKLSIITCTYNSEKYLQECIDSVIAQNLNPDIFEHIFVDGESDDNTNNIIERYKKQYSQYNIKMLSRPKKGVYNAMNEGIKEAKGEYILCLNSDDFLEPNVLNGYLDFIDSHIHIGNKQIYYGNLNIVKNKKFIKESIIKSKVKHTVKCFLWKYFGINCLVFHPTVILKKKTFLDLGMFDETKKIASDYGLWLKAKNLGYRFIHFNHAISNFRIWQESISGNKGNENVSKKEILYFAKKYTNKLQIITIYIFEYFICKFI